MYICALMGHAKKVPRTRGRDENAPWRCGCVSARPRPYPSRFSPAGVIAPSTAQRPRTRTRNRGRLRARPHIRAITGNTDNSKRLAADESAATQTLTSPLLPFAAFGRKLCPQEPTNPNRGKKAICAAKYIPKISIYITQLCTQKVAPPPVSKPLAINLRELHPGRVWREGGEPCRRDSHQIVCKLLPPG